MSIYVHCDTGGSCQNKEFLYGKEAATELHGMPHRLLALGWETRGLPAVDSCPECTERATPPTQREAASPTHNRRRKR